MSTSTRSVVYRLIADASGVLAGTRQASAAMKQFGNEITAVSKEGEKVRKGFDTMGRNAGRAGLIAAAGLGVMAAKAANFEQAISNVAAATHESEQNMTKLRDAAIDAGGRTQFSATEAADAVTELAKAGVATADILGKNGALNGALALAAAGELGVGEAAELTATSLTQFQLAGSEAVHVSDLLAAGAGKAQGTVQDMGLALSYAGITAADLGVSIEETAGAIALFSSNGLIGERAGTSLRGMLTAITSPSKIAQKTMDDLGISMFDASGEFIGLAGVADQLQSKMGTLTEQERKAALGRIFGNETINAANILYREGAAGVENWTRQVDDSGFAAETARIKTDNLRGDIERLGGAIDTLLISGGSGSQGFLRGITQGATGAVDALNGMPPSLQNTATGMLAITAITGGGLWFGTKVVRGIADTREALENLQGVGTIASRALKGVALAGAGLTSLLVTVEAIKAIQRATEESLPGLNSLNQQLIDLQSGRISSLSGEFDSLGDSIARIGEHNEALHFDITGASGLVGFSDKLDSLFGLQPASLREANAEIEALDQSLASLVQQGSPELAANALLAVGEASGLTEEQMAELTKLLPAYKDALAGTANEADLAAAAQKRVADSNKNLANTMGFTTDQIKKARDAYREAKDKARGIGDEFFGIGEKVDKAKVSLSQWIDDLVKQAKALEDFTANAKKAADKGLTKGLIKALEDAGPAGALRLQQLADSSDSEIDRANKAWRRGQKAIENYVKATTKIPNPLRIDANTKPAMTALDALKREINQLRGVQMDVRLGGTPHLASGGPVYGPGSATSDSIPAYLSNGEYVIKAAAVARYGVAMFDRLNAMRFASGGFVGASSSGGSDNSALIAALGNQRPLANVVNLQPHNYNDFTRQESRIRIAAAANGMPQR